MRSSYKYYSRLKVYKNSTGSFFFDPATMECKSYNWYYICRMIKGKLVFNSYNYSNTTNAQVWNCRGLLDKLNQVPFVEIDDPNGLTYGIDSVIKNYESKIKDLLFKLNQPRIRKKTKEGIVYDINHKYEIIQKLKTLL
jgi:hypothetical protein